MSRTTRYITRSLLVLWLCSNGTPLSAQTSPSLYDYARPHLEWYTIETDHFLIHFHGEEGGSASSRTAQVVARVAEDVFGHITDLYEHVPDTKVSIILKDYEDYSNGAAYFFDNKIEIWVPALDTPLRGASNWLRNVISHEFTHIIQVQKAVKSSRKLPIAYLQWLRYEDVKRPDVLYGYPSGIVSYPIPALNNPAWLAEGTAQYQRASMDYDRWDSHRDMLLRMKILSGKPFELEDMGSFFNKNSLEREQIYNTGYAFSLYLADRFGEEVLRSISAALANWDVWNVEKAIKRATGIPGRVVFHDWIEMLRSDYGAGAEAIGEPVAGRVLQEHGFLNRTPRFSPTGDTLAYVSNKGQDFSRTSLYVQDLSSGESTAYHINGMAGEAGGYTCSHGIRLKRGVASGISWHPSGDSIAYARVADSPRGHLVSDLYVLDLKTHKSRKISDGLRAASPAYDHSGNQIAYVWQSDGNRNIGVLNVTTGDTTVVTAFKDGTQATEPTWGADDQWIYFAANRGFGRNIFRVRSDGSNLTPLLVSEHDIRSPAVGPDGLYLYFVSDATGIFNLYRVGFDELRSALANNAMLRPEDFESLSNVLGGAFSPDVSSKDEVAFESYAAGGYNINLATIAATSDASRASEYQAPGALSKRINGQPDSFLQRQAEADSEIRAIDPARLPGANEDSLLQVSVGKAVGTSFRGLSKYTNAFTSFTFLPVVRFDMYARHGRLAGSAGEQGFQGGRVWRNTKLGVYMSSREVLEGLSIFGGFMIGPGSVRHASLADAFAPSNLVRLERDIFLQMDYKKGFKRIPKRWSPQVSVEMFHVRRNVQDGLSIEESPCTACYPDTTSADIAYSLWEASLYLRSKPAQMLLIEGGIRYSPYKVRTESFYSREYRQTITSSSSRYFIGKAASLRLFYELPDRSRHSDVIPAGIRAILGYEYEPGRLLDSFEVIDGSLVAKYAQYKNHRLNLDLRYVLRFKDHGIGIRMRGTTIVGGEVDDFFDDYVGGLTGARGYPFYSMGGNETAWLNVSYYVPILPDINRQLLFLYATKLYGRIYFDAAAAWRSGGTGSAAFRKDVGAELRLGLGSFYLFPTAAFVSATYALDQFDYEVDPRFVGPGASRSISYGHTVNWHFGLLFDFDI